MVSKPPDSPKYPPPPPPASSPRENNGARPLPYNEADMSRIAGARRIVLGNPAQPTAEQIVAAQEPGIRITATGSSYASERPTELPVPRFDDATHYADGAPRGGLLGDVDLVQLLSAPDLTAEERSGIERLLVNGNTRSQLGFVFRGDLKKKDRLIVDAALSRSVNRRPMSAAERRRLLHQVPKYIAIKDIVHLMGLDISYQEREALVVLLLRVITARIDPVPYKDLSSGERAVLDGIRDRNPGPPTTTRGQAAEQRVATYVSGMSLFNPTAYLASNPDVAKAGTLLRGQALNDFALNHFLNVGAAEGRNPLGTVTIDPIPPKWYLRVVVFKDGSVTADMSDREEHGFPEPDTDMQTTWPREALLVSINRKDLDLSRADRSELRALVRDADRAYPAVLQQETFTEARKALLKKLVNEVHRHPTTIGTKLQAVVEAEDNERYSGSSRKRARGKKRGERPDVPLVNLMLRHATDLTPEELKQLQNVRAKYGEQGFGIRGAITDEDAQVVEKILNRMAPPEFPQRDSFQTPTLPPADEPKRTARVVGKSEKQTVIIRDRKEAVRYAHTLTAYFDERIAEREAQRRHNNPPPDAVLEDDSEYLSTLKQIAQELKRLNELLSKKQTKPAKVQASGIEVAKHANSFFKYAMPILGLGTSCLIVAVMADLLRSLGLPLDLLPQLLSLKPH